MQAHEAEEFVKLFEAMDRRFRAQFSFPVFIVRGFDNASWVLSRTQKEIFLASRRRKTQSAGIKGLKGLKKTTNLWEFRIFTGYIRFFSGENRNMHDMGEKRAEISVGAPCYNWIGSTKNLMRRLGEIEEIRANLSDPKLI
jgi:hypothetical protein